jgi:hypothetical protein
MRGVAKDDGVREIMGLQNKLLSNPETFFLSLLVKGTHRIQSGMDTQGVTIGVYGF